MRNKQKLGAEYFGGVRAWGCPSAMLAGCVEGQKGRVPAGLSIVCWVEAELLGFGGWRLCYAWRRRPSCMAFVDAELLGFGEDRSALVATQCGACSCACLLEGAQSLQASPTSFHQQATAQLQGFMAPSCLNCLSPCHQPAPSAPLPSVPPAGPVTAPSRTASPRRPPWSQTARHAPSHTCLSAHHSI